MSYSPYGNFPVLPCEATKSRSVIDKNEKWECGNSTDVIAALQGVSELKPIIRAPQKHMSKAQRKQYRAAEVLRFRKITENQSQLSNDQGSLQNYSYEETLENANNVKREIKPENIKTDVLEPEEEREMLVKNRLMEFLSEADKEDGANAEAQPNAVAEVGGAIATEDGEMGVIRGEEGVVKVETKPDLTDYDLIVKRRFEENLAALLRDDSEDETNVSPKPSQPKLFNQALISQFTFGKRSDSDAIKCGRVNIPDDIGQFNKEMAAEAMRQMRKLYSKKDGEEDFSAWKRRKSEYVYKFNEQMPIYEDDFLYDICAYNFTNDRGKELKRSRSGAKNKPSSKGWSARKAQEDERRRIKPANLRLKNEPHLHVRDVVKNSNVLALRNENESSRSAQISGDVRNDFHPDGNFGGKLEVALPAKYDSDVEIVEFDSKRNAQTDTVFPEGNVDGKPEVTPTENHDSDVEIVNEFDSGNPQADATFSEGNFDSKVMVASSGNHDSDLEIVSEYKLPPGSDQTCDRNEDDATGKNNNPKSAECFSKKKTYSKTDYVPPDFKLDSEIAPFLIYDKVESRTRVYVGSKTVSTKLLRSIEDRVHLEEGFSSRSDRCDESRRSRKVYRRSGSRRSRSGHRSRSISRRRYGSSYSRRRSRGSESGDVGYHSNSQQRDTSYDSPRNN